MVDPPLRTMAQHLNPGGRFEDEDLGIAGMVWSHGPYPHSVWVVRDDGICQVVRLTRGIPVPWELGETYVPTGREPAQ